MLINSQRRLECIFGVFVLIVASFLADGGHAAADHPRNFPFSVQKRRQRLQLLRRWKVGDLSSSSVIIKPLLVIDNC